MRPADTSVFRGPPHRQKTYLSWVKNWHLMPIDPLSTKVKLGTLLALIPSMRPISYYLVSLFMIGFAPFGRAEPSSDAASRESKPALGLTLAETPAAAPEVRTYADTFTPLRDTIRAYEQDPANRYAYCIRNVATYECLRYGSDGSVRRRQHEARMHGTGFAYKLDGDQTRLLTNEHVVIWPFVTDSEHRVEDIPSGCKLVGQTLSIVDNDDDEFEEDDIPLTRVLEDTALDAAVLRAKGKLRLLPYRIGRSAALSPGDVVIVRGFPLGVFQAYNTGKVINTYDLDQYQRWDHVDFVIDAQLSSGNSGSPVLALNRRTGEYELVGVFHASYNRANGLNEVIAIDQLQELMFQLKRPDRARRAVDVEQLPDEEQRRRLHKALGQIEFVPYLALGPLPVRIQAISDSLVYEVFPSSFPRDRQRVAVLLDTPEPSLWGKLKQVWFGSSRGYKRYGTAELDSESQELLKRVVKRLHELATSALQESLAANGIPDSRQASERRLRQNRARARAVEDAEMAQLLLDLASREAPAGAAEAVALTDVFAHIASPQAPSPALLPAPAPNASGSNLLAATPSP